MAGTGKALDGLSVGGLYEHYMTGQGQPVSVDIDKLKENLSPGKITNLSKEIAKANLPDGTAQLDVTRTGAVFTGAEAYTLGGVVVDVHVEVTTVNHVSTVTGGSWNLAIPDLYDFSPVVAPHRSWKANLVNVAENIVEALAGTKVPGSPITSQGFKVNVVDFHAELSRVFHREVSHL